MKTRLTVFLAGVLLAALSGTAAADGRINVDVIIGAPGYTYMAPPPVYYYPPAPVYYAPAPWAVRHHRDWDRDWHRHHRHWNRRHW